MRWQRRARARRDRLGRLAELSCQQTGSKFLNLGVLGFFSSPEFEDLPGSIEMFKRGVREQKPS